MKTVSIVAPVYFEQELIQEFYTRLAAAVAPIDQFQFEFIFVNDGSTDKSLDFLLDIRKSDERVKIVDFSRNFGHQYAITAGIDFAIGDAVVLIDSDLQDPPELISELVKKWQEGYQVAYAKRKKRPGESFVKLITASVYYRLLSKLSDVDIPTDTGDFRLMDRVVVDALKGTRESSRYIRGLVAWLGFRQTAVMYERDVRFAGETKFTLSKMLRFAFDGIAGFSDKPLYLSIYLSSFFGLIAFIGVIRVMFAYFQDGDSLVAGWTSIIVIVSILGSVQLLAMGILGQYIARIYKETQQRPLYVVAKTYGIKEGEDG